MHGFAIDVIWHPLRQFYVTRDEKAPYPLEAWDAVDMGEVVLKAKRHKALSRWCASTKKAIEDFPPSSEVRAHGAGYNPIQVEDHRLDFLIVAARHILIQSNECAPTQTSTPLRL
jgi:hypothetical protein